MAKIYENYVQNRPKDVAWFYELKRSTSSGYINAYNPTILDHWQANMDIQIVGNAQSAAYYVCAYLCKSEPESIEKCHRKFTTKLQA